MLSLSEQVMIFPNLLVILRSLLTNYCKAPLSWSFFGRPVLNIKTVFLHQMTHYIVFSISLLLPFEQNSFMFTSVISESILSDFCSFILVGGEGLHCRDISPLNELLAVQ